MSWIVYHNEDCSKSRLALDFLKEKGIGFSLRNYILEPLSKIEILELQRLLGIPIIDLVRTGETVFGEKYTDKHLSDSEISELLVRHPYLLQRPIVSNGTQAVIARPAEKIQSLL